MDAASACGFFDLILGLFVEADTDDAGKLIGELKMHAMFNTFTHRLHRPVLDEAHKVGFPNSTIYLSPESSI